MKELAEILNFTLYYNSKVSISVKTVIITIGLLFLASYLLKLLKRFVSKKLNEQDINKFDTVFSFGKWLLYIIVFLVALESSGIDITAIFAASAALLIGVGLALQTFFQDIISGIFIILDQSVHVGDVIELDGKVGRVEEIKLRTTRAVTIDNKVLVIPNHLYLTHSLYNWTQNGISTRERIKINVAYGSNVELVKETLIQAAYSHSAVLEYPEPFILFEDFGDNGLNFTLIFTVEDSFKTSIIKSDIRFAIDRLFRKHKIEIPFPQRVIHTKVNS